jgi:hypothetical protein
LYVLIRQFYLEAANFLRAWQWRNDMTRSGNLSKRSTQAVVLVIVVGGWLALNFWQSSRLTPSMEARSFAGFVATMPTPGEVNLLLHEGQTYIEVEGAAPWFTFSGSPAYIFDTNGLMVEWFLDREDLRYDQGWGTVSNRVRISVEEAFKKITDVSK